MYSILLIFLRIIHTSIMGRYNIIFTCNVSNDPFSIEKKKVDYYSHVENFVVQRIEVFLLHMRFRQFYVGELFLRK